MSRVQILFQTPSKAYNRKLFAELCLPYYLYQPNTRYFKGNWTGKLTWTNLPYSSALQGKWRRKSILVKGFIISRVWCLHSLNLQERFIPDSIL